MKNIYTQRAGAIIAFCFLLFSSINSFAQVGIGTTTPNVNAKLDIVSTVAEPGGMLLPRLALSALNNTAPLPGPVAELQGMTVYNTVTAGSGVNQVTPGFYYHDGSTWVRISGGSGPNTSWDILGNAGTNAGTNFLGTTDNNALRFRTNNADRFEITSGNAASRGRLRSFENGNAAQPTYSWNANVGTGMFQAGADNLGFSTNANERMRILADGRVTVNNTGAYAFMLNSSAAGPNGAVIGASVNGVAVQGQASGSGDGVRGFATSGTGVYGQATSANAEGGFFYGAHTNAFGLYASGGNGPAYAFNSSGTGAAITGRAYGATSIAAAVDGLGMAGIGDNLAAIPARPLGIGVLGYGYQTGVFGDSGYYSQRGVHGRAEGNSVFGNGTGVFGENVGSFGFGVAGESTNIGVYGFGAHGAIFESANDGGFGAWIENISAAGIGMVVAGQNLGAYTLPQSGAVFTGNLRAGVGFAENNNGTGLVGVGNNITTANMAANGSGVAGTGNRLGVYGKANRSADGIGVIGLGNDLGTYTIPANGAGVAGTGVNIGVYGHATDAAGYGVYSSGNLFADGDISAIGDIAGDGFSFAGGDLAINGDGSIGGDLTVAGNSTVTGTKSFLIDDPRDPANKYLKHFSVESNEILNIYRGVISFDTSGEAVAQLPDYFDAINKNASYQLTPIGAAMPNLYIAKKVENGSFVIAGGIPGKEVSWTLTAERNDPYIHNNPEVKNVVMDKGADRGRYLAPEVYGQPAERGILQNRMTEIQNGSAPTVARKAISFQEMKSNTMEATKLDSEEASKLTTTLKSRRTESSTTKELRDVPMEKAEKVEVSAKVAELEGQNTSDTSDNAAQSSKTIQQPSESEQAPAKIIGTQDNN